MKNKGKIKEYLNKSFGWNIEFESFDSQRGKLPYALLEAADYSKIRCLDFNGIAIAPKSEDDFRVTRRLVETVQHKTGMPVLLIIENLDFYQRRVLIDNRINFIVPDRQVYFPTLGIMMNERGLGTRQPLSGRLSPVAAAIIIVQLSKCSLQDKSVSQAAEIMGYSVKTLSVAVNELEQFGLVNIRHEGRKKILDFTLSAKELWDKTYAMSESPVEKRLFTFDRDMASELGVKASDTALSEISMLAAPQQEVYAVYARNPRLKEMGLNANDGTAIIEVWKTDPALSAKDGNADIFSLALTYKHDDDPRIRKELDKILSETL